MYLYKIIPINNKLSRVQENKVMHEEAFRLLEQNLIEKFHFKKEDLKYKYGLRGKPYLETSPLCFSISHCNNIIVCIISERNVGIDIEEVKKINRFIVSKALTQKEQEELKKVQAELLDKKNEYFFRLWTLKEALMKTIGDGLSYGMKNIEFNISRDSLFCNNNLLKQDKKDISCNLKGFIFKQEKLCVDDKEYIVSISMEDSNDEY